MEVGCGHRYYITHPGIGNGSRARIRLVLQLAGSPRYCFPHEEVAQDLGTGEAQEL